MPAAGDLTQMPRRSLSLGSAAGSTFGFVKRSPGPFYGPTGNTLDSRLDALRGHAHTSTSGAICDATISAASSGSDSVSPWSIGP